MLSTICTADLKDLYVVGGRDLVPFLTVIDKLLKRGVDVQLLHAKKPGWASARISTSILDCGANRSGDSDFGYIFE